MREVGLCHHLVFSNALFRVCTVVKTARWRLTLSDWFTEQQHSASNLKNQNAELLKKVTHNKNFQKRET